MTGGIVQLSLWGAEDIVLSSQPQVTLFRTAFRRVTPFSLDAVEQQFQGAADFGRRSSLVLSRTGDLATDVWLQITLPSLWTVFEPSTRLPAQPVVKAARYTSPTSARVVVVPSTARLGSTTTVYRATLTPDPATAPPGTVAVSAFSTLADPTTINVTGLVAGVKYTAAVVTHTQATATATPSLDAGETVSASADVICLKWCNNVGHALIESVELTIGGSRIDRHTSDWMDIWTELTVPEEKKAGLYEMLGKFDAYDPLSPTGSFDEERTLFVPLQFFFCQNPGMALPLLALVYHETRLEFSFREYKDCLRSTGRAVSSLTDDAGYPLAVKEIKAYCTQVFLDVEERRRYATIPQEYLITVTQFLGDAAINVQPGDALVRKVPIEFSHPVKELVWVYQPRDAYAGTSTTLDWFGYGDDDWCTDLKIQINGTDRNVARPAAYYRLCQPYAHHTRVPAKRISLYSFAIYPENVQSSGTCNFSRLDTAHLVATLNPTVSQGRLRIYATSYNVLRIANGLGGLSFAG